MLRTTQTILLCLTCTFIPGCAVGNSPTDTPPVVEPGAPRDARLDAVAFIAGHWTGSMGSGVIEEHWLTPSGGTMIGTARLVSGERTAFFEYLRIERRAGGEIVYVAQPKGRCPPTDFTLTRSSEREAVFENPTHDDPKLIRYTLSENGRTMTTVTEGESGGKPTRTQTVMQRAP